jgi:hypothetical protein
MRVACRQKHLVGGRPNGICKETRSDKGIKPNASSSREVKMKKGTAVIGSVASATGVFLISLMAMSCGMISLLGLEAVQHPAIIAWQPLIPFAVYAIGIPLVLVWLALIHWRGDSGILGAAIMLSAIGVLIQFRMGSFSQLDLKNNIFPVLPFAIGLVAFVLGVTLTAKGRGGWLQALGWGAYIAAVGVLVGMMVLGRSYRGGIYLTGNINPTEIVKPLLVFFLATHLSQRQKEFSETVSGIPVPPLSSLLGLILLWGVPMALTIFLRDLGLVVLLNTILIIMLFCRCKTNGVFGDWTCRGCSSLFRHAVYLIPCASTFRCLVESVHGSNWKRLANFARVDCDVLGRVVGFWAGYRLTGDCTYCDLGLYLFGVS